MQKLNFAVVYACINMTDCLSSSFPFPRDKSEGIVIIQRAAV